MSKLFDGDPGLGVPKMNDGKRGWHSPYDKWFYIILLIIALLCILFK